MNSTSRSQLARILAGAFSNALADVNIELSSDQIDPVLQLSRHADFQANAAMSLGKRFGLVPRELATKVMDYAQINSAIESMQIAGPGFINITLSNTFLSAELSRVSCDTRLGVPSIESKTVVVDYSSPNVAKEMHVGHLRSTVIGDACVCLLEWMGHKVIRRNHIGDWGTPFGMLIEHLHDQGEGASSSALSLGDLNTFYRQARQKFDADEAFRERARTRVVALQAGDEETMQSWNTLVELSRRYFLDVYKKIDVRLDGSEFRGESTYNDKLESIVEHLRGAGVLELSDSAECVFLDGFTSRDDKPIPLIVRKSDGGFGYAATDLAALRERTEQLNADRLLYVVGAPQRQHFEMIFALGAQLGWLNDTNQAEHISFGSVLGQDGKMLASRSGVSVKLVELLNQAVARAAETVAAKNPQLDQAEQQRIAEAVGIGAVKYADLSVDKTSDYVFDFDKMLALEGNTAPYLQYANARINSLLRNHDVPVNKVFDVQHEAEHELALVLLEFGDIVTDVEATLHFHRLAKYLFDLASAFSRFYSKCPILKAETEALRDSRLALASLCGTTLQIGLSLLGIRTPQRM